MSSAAADRGLQATDGRTDTQNSHDNPRTVGTDGWPGSVPGQTARSGRWVRLARKLSRNARAARAIAQTARHGDYPLLAHIVPMRRCNVACGYCNEHDHASAPVPVPRLLRWLDRLQDLHTAFVTCSGGEPLLHPQIASVVAAIRDRGMIPGLITNGYLLSPPRIDELNAAGLDYLQVSIDNVEPDAVSKKSLSRLGRQLQALADHAEFDVNVNSVLGGGTARAEDVRTIASFARSLGFSASVGVIHDQTGRLKPLSPVERAVWDEFNASSGGRWQVFRNFYSGLNAFQENLVDGRPNVWRCRAGARYLYIAEDGLVSLCSQQRGYPGIPIEEYGVEDVRRAFTSLKPCAPFCTVSCSHRVATLDACLDPFREKRDALRRSFQEEKEQA